MRRHFFKWYYEHPMDSRFRKSVMKGEDIAASPPQSTSASSVPRSTREVSAPLTQNLQPDVKSAAGEKEQKTTLSHAIAEQGQKTAASSTPVSSLITHASTHPGAMCTAIDKGETTASSPPAFTISSNYKVSPHFNAKDADIAFQSADNILYYVHRKNLECAATGFPTNRDNNTIIPMTEKSDILDLLLGFTYPRPSPNVKDLPFKTLSKLASAAEKYKVYSAITICKIYMDANVKQHPIGVLRYAASYCYIELLDTVAPIAIQERLAVVVSELPPEVAIVWVYYYQEWRDAVRGLTDPQKRPSSCTCPAWPSICLSILDKIEGRVESFFDLDRIFAKPATGCLKCLSNVSVWHTQANEIYATMSKFSKYLFPKLSKGGEGIKSHKATPTPSASDQTHAIIPESASATSIGGQTRQNLFQFSATMASPKEYGLTIGDSFDPGVKHVHARIKSTKRMSDSFTGRDYAAPHVPIR